MGENDRPPSQCPLRLKGRMTPSSLVSLLNAFNVQGLVTTADEKANKQK